MISLLMAVAAYSADSVPTPPSPAQGLLSPALQAPVVPPPPAAAAPAPAPAAPVTGGPRIKFESTVHDFGKISGGDIAKCDFVFTNVGDKLLEITDVHPSCGCTTAGQWTRQVEPGKTGIIPLQFNSANFNGAVTKTATVTCNDPTQQSIILQLKATIWRPIEVTPQFAILNLTTEAPSNSTIVRIVNNLDTPLTLSDVESKNPAFAAEVKTVTEGKEYQLVVRTVPPFPTANVQGQVTVKTSSTNMPLVSVTAWANLQQTVMAMPAQVSLPAGPLANSLTQTVWVRNNSSNNISLSEAAVNAKGADVQLKDFQPGRYFSLTLTFPAGFQVGATEKVELSVKTSHPQYPVIKIPVIQPQAVQPAVPFGPLPPPPATPTSSAVPKPAAPAMH